MSNKKVLFIRGLDDSQEVIVTNINKDGFPNIELEGETKFYMEYIAKDSIKTQITFDSQYEQEIEVSKELDLIVNQFSHAHIGSIAFAKLEQVYNNYKESIVFINTPDALRKSSKDQLHILLEEIEGLHTIKTFAIYPTSSLDVHNAMLDLNLKYPAFMQSLNNTGTKPYRLQIKDTNEKLLTLPLDNRPYYLSENITVPKNILPGVYYLACIDGTVYLEYLDVAKDTSTYADFESEIEPSIKDTFILIHKQVQLDYFRVVCRFTDDFEIYLYHLDTASTFKTTKNLNKEAICTAFTKLIESK